MEEISLFVSICWPFSHTRTTYFGKRGVTEAAQVYDSLRIFVCPTYHCIKEDKLDSRAKKSMFLWFKRVVKGYKIWDSKDKKTID